MGNLATRFSIGEKIGVGFGLVGLLFLAVIWQFHDTLHRSMHDYTQLQAIQGATKDRMLSIESALLRARGAEQHFLQTRDLHQAQRVINHIHAAILEAASLSKIDPQNHALSDEITGDLENYLQHFKEVKAAWIMKGLNENAGLQGSFRQAVHDLQARASNLPAI